LAIIDERVTAATVRRSGMRAVHATDSISDIDASVTHHAMSVALLNNVCRLMTLIRRFLVSSRFFLLTAGPLDISCPPGAWQQTRRNGGVRRPEGTESCIDPAPHMRTVPKKAITPQYNNGRHPPGNFCRMVWEIKIDSETILTAIPLRISTVM